MLAEESSLIDRQDTASTSTIAAIRPPRKTVPWKKILCNGPVWALAVAKFGYYYSFFMTVTWMPTYLREMGMSEHLAVRMYFFSDSITLLILCVTCKFHQSLPIYISNYNLFFIISLSIVKSPSSFFFIYLL